MSRKCLSIATSPILQNSCVPPKIIVQPISQQVTSGISANFVVVASGTNLKYQWQKNGVDIVGAIHSNYSVIYAGSTDAASYTVKIYNDCGSILSAVALLVVNGGGGNTVTTLQFVVDRGLGAPYFDPVSETSPGVGNANYVNANLNGKNYIVFRPGLAGLVWGVNIALTTGGGFHFIDGTVFYPAEGYTLFILS